MTEITKTQHVTYTVELTVEQYSYVISALMMVCDSAMSQSNIPVTVGLLADMQAAQ